MGIEPTTLPHSTWSCLPNFLIWKPTSTLCTYTESKHIKKNIPSTRNKYFTKFLYQKVIHEICFRLKDPDFLISTINKNLIKNWAIKKQLRFQVWSNINTCTCISCWAGRKCMTLLMCAWTARFVRPDQEFTRNDWKLSNRTILK